MMTGFVNTYVRELPGEEGASSESSAEPRQVYGAAWSPARAEPVSAPQLRAWNASLAEQLGLTIEKELCASVFSGNRLMDGMQPYAACYGGHQFGQWAGQLGDGRVINLGEWQAADDQNWTLQLKGAGRTPYSRHADGRAVLRSSIREYLCSEAMHHLGIPTTRALSLVETGDMVVRDMFYDGNPQNEPGAIVCRAAPGFLRFGHFELPAVRGELDVLRALLHYSVRHDYPELAPLLATSTSDAERVAVYLQWFSAVCDRSMNLVVAWQRVGFVHGVLNTDNMAVNGLTIDYGPYGWIDDYDPNCTPNTTDAGQRRYRFGAQPEIVRWNLFRLANAIYPLIGEAEPLQDAVDVIAVELSRRLHQMMADKLGVDAEDLAASPVKELLEQALTAQETDMTLFFRSLSEFGRSHDNRSLQVCVQSAFYAGELRAENLDLYRRLEEQYRLLIRDPDDESRRDRMKHCNPRYVLRNYLAQQAIDAAHQGDWSVFDELSAVLRQPYADQPQQAARFGALRPDWARSRAGCSMLSCSS
ncbi:protein adenylyltransferase SelO [Pseudohongiella spirulinae]|uniref:Protein nucleotidyltransferase YdiU n=1 Tax=Pseudohongiella spirulinae TaxID=1249552 RepID=A0A0S2KD68_9GAMM|nr:YdiU family protein [Pseudohongiella spirulinae]ALO46262.1 hypothetical protein PS2015_1609 [Pseudohongiella spirulinae]